MDTVKEHALSDLMAGVKAADASSSNNGTVHFFFTLLNPAAVKAGPEILKLFESRLHERYPGAKVECQGYAADGYNIKAAVTRRTVDKSQEIPRARSVEVDS